jgi:hypothetical protein
MLGWLFGTTRTLAHHQVEKPVPEFQLSLQPDWHPARQNKFGNDAAAAIPNP